MIQLCHDNKFFSHKMTNRQLKNTMTRHHHYRDILPSVITIPTVLPYRSYCTCEITTEFFPSLQ